MIIRGARVYQPDGLKEADIEIRGGRIWRIARGLKGRGIRARGLIAIPGAIDLQAHCYPPESPQSLSAAALAGGITTVVVHSSVEPKGWGVNWISSFTERPFDKTDLLGVQKKLFIRPEDADVNAYFERRYPKAPWSNRHPPLAEAMAVAQVVAAGCTAHLSPITTAASLRFVRMARSNGIAITCATTPHHLLLSADLLKRFGDLARTDPPLRSASDVRALWEGIYAGWIDALSSDHHPIPRESKRDRSGIPSIQTMLPLALDRLRAGQLSISQLVSIFAENPARILGLSRKGYLYPGYDADIVLIDLHRSWVVRSDDLHSAAGWSLYEGRRIRGMPVMTILKGKLAMSEGQIYRTKGECLNERISTKGVETR